MLSLALINLAVRFSSFSEVVAITFVCTLLSVSSVSPGDQNIFHYWSVSYYLVFFSIFFFLISVPE